MPRLLHNIYLIIKIKEIWMIIREYNDDDKAYTTFITY